MLHYLKHTENNDITPDTATGFNRKLKEHTLKNTPTVERKFFTHQLPTYIIKLIKTKRKIYREYCNTGLVELKQSINDFNKNIHKMII